MMDVWFLMKMIANDPVKQLARVFSPRRLFGLGARNGAVSGTFFRAVLAAENKSHVPRKATVRPFFLEN
jgi:hypothetical protein